MEEIQSKTRTPADDGSTARLEAVEQHVALLDSANYRAEQNRLVLGDDYAWGLLDPSYIRDKAYGPAYVYINGVQTSAACEWATPYQRTGARSVKLARLPGEKYIILGQTDSIPGTAVQEYRVTLGTDWWAYNERYNSRVWGEPRATVLPSGIVSLRGIVMKNGTPGNTEVIATIPAAIAPDVDQYFYVNNADIARAVVVKTNGDIICSASGFAANQYVSLDTIRYPMKGVASWTNVGSGGSSWGANFEDFMYNGVPCQFWKDPYGFVWFRGLAKVKNATSSDNTVMLTLPAGYGVATPGGEQHFRTTANDGYGGIGAGPIGAQSSLVWKTNTPGTVGSWIALSGVLITTAEAVTTNNWWTLTWKQNNWVRNSSGQPDLMVTRRGDGLVCMRGLVASGSFGTKIGNLPEDYMPRQRLLVDVIANQARGRLDIRGVNDINNVTDDQGSLYMYQGGAGSWFSFDGLAYAP